MQVDRQTDFTLTSRTTTWRAESRSGLKDAVIMFSRDVLCCLVRDGTVMAMHDLEK
jgi:hypothetical protein